MTDLGGWLATKYSVLGTQADAAERHATAAIISANKQGDASLLNAQTGQKTGGAQANLLNTQAGEIPADSAARRGLQGSETGLNQSLTGKQNQFNNQFNGLYDSGSSTQVPSTQVPGIHTTPDASGSFYYSHGTANVPDRPASSDELTALHHHLLTMKAGATQVPGKGDGTVDKVSAMLAPGEAVLNKGAAEHFGRHNIAALNAVGQAKMQAGKGAPPPAKAAPAKPQHFKGGTHMVGHGKSAQTPKIDPGVIQALMSMGGGGGGPAAGGAPMMPPAPGMIPPGR